MTVFRFRVLKDGSRALKGKIAEAVFNEIRQEIKQKRSLPWFRSLKAFCSTCDIRHILERRGLNVRSPDNARNILPAFDKILKRVNELLNQLNFEQIPLEELRIRLKGSSMGVRCLLCGALLREPRRKKKSYSITTTFRLFSICDECFNKCLNMLVKQGDTYVAKERLKELVDFIDQHRELIALSRYKEALEVLALMNREEFAFLQEVYGRGGSGHAPFDYVCVTDDGTKCLIDVTSTTGRTVGPLSEREREVAKMAKKIGFKILIPKIRFLYPNYWIVELELSEPQL